MAAILYIMNYARKVKADPTKSIMYGVESEFVQRKSLDELTGAKMNTRQKICLLIFFATLGLSLIHIWMEKCSPSKAGTERKSRRP